MEAKLSRRQRCDYPSAPFGDQYAGLSLPLQQKLMSLLLRAYYTLLETTYSLEQSSREMWFAPQHIRAATLSP